MGKNCQLDWFTLSVLLLLLSLNSVLCAQDRVRVIAGSPNNQMRVVNTYPEYWVDGAPFFQHAATFHYYRLPRDRWAEEMVALRDMGLNTLDILPMWNWHEPEEGKLDFDGHTNPRRDLKYALQLTDSLGFKITFRPGPYNTNEWRNGGYPDWLLRRPEYQMTQQEILEGRFPRWSALQYERSEVAASEWLKNNTHLRYTQKYYHDILGFASPLFADRGGPILSVQMDDDQAIGPENYNGPSFWKYMDTLRKFAKQATDNRPLIYYIDGAEMRLNAEANDALPEPFWNQGQDYQFSGGRYSTAGEAAKNKFLTEIVKTQPLFIPAHIEFQAGWWPTVDDTYAKSVDPSNTLMASRVMFQNGLKGLSYFPANDTINPAGYTIPWSTHFYMWEAALNFLGKETGRAVYMRRNGRLIQGMGPFLESSHLLPDAGVVYPMATFPQESMTGKEANRIHNLGGRLLWAGAYEHYNFELIDSDHTPLENFERYRVLFVPDVIDGKQELKQYPHLEHYSEKAQQVLADYVTAGGTLIVFPSLPKGRFFDSLFAPFGEDHRVSGESALTFDEGSTSLAFDHYFVLPKKQSAEVKPFAWNANGGVVGARLAHGKGQIVFFGADFSNWSKLLMPAFTQEGAQVLKGVEDYPEESQEAGKRMLPALMKEAGELRKVYPEMKAEKALDLGLYVTELVADSGSLPFERRANANGYGFVGVTNFSVDQARTAEIVLTDPHAQDFSAMPHRSLRLPALTLPPRESLLLPVRIPLSSPYWQMAPGIDPTDEVFYATAEISRASYDGSTLSFELTAPTDAELALHLSRRPERATLDGATAEFQEDAARRLYIVKIPRGQGPHFLRRLELAYPHEGPRVVFEAQQPWISGQTRAVRVRVENPGPAMLEGELSLVAGSFYRADNPPLEVNVSPNSQRTFTFPVEVPDYAASGQNVDLTATLRERDSEAVWAWHSQAVVRQPLDWRIEPADTFPLREDLRVPVVHPTLVSLAMPGEAAIHVHVKNWQDHEQAVTLAGTGSQIAITPALTQLVLPAGSEQDLVIRANPQGGSGCYHVTLELRSGSYRATEESVIAAVEKNEAIAYTLDYDRDGFPDVILENSNVRLFVSPYDGGRAFAFVSKTTGDNAFNSVGGMRDNFTRQVVPEDSQPDSANEDWLGLFNRPYTFNITEGAGGKVVVQFKYVASDIYPKGVSLERTLTLGGSNNYYLEETSLTPAAVAKPQAYVLESSVTFKMFDEPENYRRWFAEGRALDEFPIKKNVDLPGKAGFIGATHRRTGETFALMSLTPVAKIQLATHEHAATFRLIHPDFSVPNRPYKYEAAYFFGKAEEQDVRDLYSKLKSRKE